MHLATVGIGSNIGQRASTIRRALEELVQQTKSSIRRCSSLYETEPFGERRQRWFLNCVVQVETPLDLDTFFSVIRGIEAEFGRKRQKRWGPRTLDIDILFFDALVLHRQELQIPHPGIPHRRFVLVPLCEIAPDLVHPVLHRMVRELLEEVKDESKVIKIGSIKEEEDVPPYNGFEI